MPITQIQQSEGLERLRQDLIILGKDLLVLTMSLRDLLDANI